MLVPGLLAGASVATASDATIEVRQLSSADLGIAAFRPPRPAVIEDEQALRRQWARRGLLGDPPPVDFDHAVVVLVAAPMGPGRELVRSATLDGRRLVVASEPIAAGASPTAYVGPRLVAVEVPLAPLPPTRVRVHQDGSRLSAALPRRRPGAPPTPPTDALPPPDTVRGRVPLPPPGTVQTVTADGPSTASWRFVWKDRFGTRTRLEGARPDRWD